MNLLNPMDDDQLDAIIEGLERIKALEAEVARLREVISRAASHWIHMNPGVAWEGDIADAMAAAVAEIERLRLAIRRLAEQDATLSVCNGNVKVTMDGTLTDAECDDLRVWLAECLRQASAATEGANVELAERWNERAKRAAAMLQRQY